MQIWVRSGKCLFFCCYVEHLACFHVDLAACWSESLKAKELLYVLVLLVCMLFSQGRLLLSSLWGCLWVCAGWYYCPTIPFELTLRTHVNVFPLWNTRHTCGQLYDTVKHHDCEDVFGSEFI